MEERSDLNAVERDALREVANIGAGHAATALSQMTGRTIMINVPEVNIRRLEEVAEMLGPPETVVVAIAMHTMGDLTGQTMAILPETAARTLCDLLLRRPLGTTASFEAMEESSLKETGNILTSAYLTALSDFLGMMLVPSVPSLMTDYAGAVLTSVSPESTMVCTSAFASASRCSTSSPENPGMLRSRTTIKSRAGPGCRFPRRCTRRTTRRCC